MESEQEKLIRLTNEMLENKKQIAVRFGLTAEEASVADQMSGVLMLQAQSIYKDTRRDGVKVRDLVIRVALAMAVLQQELYENTRSDRD